MSTAEASHWSEQETGLYIDERKLTTVRLATDLKDADVPERIQVANDRLLPLEPQVIGRSQPLPGEPTTLHVADSHYRITQAGEEVRSVRLKTNRKGGSFLILNTLFAAPDCLIAYNSAQNTEALHGLLPHLLARGSVHRPLFRVWQNARRRTYVGLRQDFVLADERSAVRPAAVPVVEQLPASSEEPPVEVAPPAFDAPYGSVLFDSREIAQKGSFVHVLNLEYVNRQTDKLMAKMPTGTPCNELIILDNTHAEINGVPYPTGPLATNMMNRLLVRYQGEPVTLATLMGTASERLLKPAETFARQLSVAGTVVYQKINGQKVIFLRPLKITDTRPR